MDNNRVNSAFYLGMGYMRISFKSPTALSFRYTTIFKCEKKVCVCVCGGVLPLLCGIYKWLNILVFSDKDAKL